MKSFKLVISTLALMISASLITVDAVVEQGVQCELHEFDCDQGKTCIPLSKHCDGNEDCKVRIKFITRFAENSKIGW